MAICDKWVALKIVEFCVCVACLVAKRISSDDEARLALLLQKLSREWSLLTSVTWDSVGGAFADAIYGGYVIITFGLLLGRVFQEVPKGRRILEGFLLGMGMLFFIILGGLELASLDSVPHRLIVNASVLGAFSLLVAALFLLDLMGPRPYTTHTHAQTDAQSHAHNTTTIQVVGTANAANGNGHLPNGNTNGHIPNGNGHIPNGNKNGLVPNGHQNGHIPNGKPKNVDVKANNDKQNKPLETDLDEFTEKIKKDESLLFEQPNHGYTKFDDKEIVSGLEKSKFGSVRNEFEEGKYVRLSDPLAEPDRLHYERELAKFNERYLRDYLDTVDGRFEVKENYLPEPQTPQFAKVKTGRLKSLYDDVSPTYEQKCSSKSPTRVRTIATPTLQQLEDYLRSSSRARRGDTPALFPMEPIEERGREAMEHELGRASGTPTDPGYVQYTADKWPDKRQIRTPRHSPTH